MSALHIAPRGGDASRRPGDVVEVDCEWTLAEVPETLEARLLWYVEGVGKRNVAVVAERPLTPSERGRERLKFKLPDAPYSFAGELFSLQWAIELVADDAVARWDFTLAPGGAAIQLRSL